jgi:tetratricopeptide (TPR) repeat protein
MGATSTPRPAPPASVQSVPSAESVLLEAQNDERFAARELAFIAWVSSGWLILVTFIFAFILFLGWQELGFVRLARAETQRAKEESQGGARDATAAAERAGAAEKELDKTKERLKEMEQSSQRAMHTVQEHITGALSLERRSIVAEPPELPDSKTIQLFEEADIVIVLAEKSKWISPEDLVTPFIQLGNYWRLVENYPRAIARCERAIELDGDNWEAHRAKCKALYSLAAKPFTGPGYKARLLAEAIAECRRSLEMVGTPHPGLLFDLGWIYDEMGDYDKAVKCYRGAQRVDAQRDYPSIAYNLACSLSKLGEYGAALRELKTVIDVDNNWEDAPRDPDLEGLRNDRTYGASFQALVESVKNAAPPNGQEGPH